MIVQKTVRLRNFTAPWLLPVGVAREIVSQFVYPDTDAQLHDEHVIAVCEEVTFTLRYAAAMKSSFREVRGVDTALIRCYSSVCCVCRFRREAYG